VTINQLVKSLQKILKTVMAPQYQSSREGDIYHSLADIRKISEQLGWYPKWDLAQCLSDWLR